MTSVERVGSTYGAQCFAPSRVAGTPCWAKATHLFITRSDTAVAALRPPSQNVGSLFNVPKLPKT